VPEIVSKSPIKGLRKTVTSVTGSRVHGSGFKVKAMKEGLYSLDKDPVHPGF